MPRMIGSALCHATAAPPEFATLPASAWSESAPSSMVIGQGRGRSRLPRGTMGLLLGLWTVLTVLFSAAWATFGGGQAAVGESPSLDSTAAFSRSGTCSRSGSWAPCSSAVSEWRDDVLPCAVNVEATEYANDDAPPDMPGLAPVALDVAPHPPVIRHAAPDETRTATSRLSMSTGLARGPPSVS